MSLDMNKVKRTADIIDAVVRATIVAKDGVYDRDPPR